MYKELYGSMVSSKSSINTNPHHCSWKGRQNFWMVSGFHERSEVNGRCMKPEQGASDLSPCGSELALILNSTTLLPPYQQLFQLNVQRSQWNEWTSLLKTYKNKKTPFPATDIRDWSMVCLMCAQTRVCRIGSLWTSIKKKYDKPFRSFLVQMQSSPG